MSNKSILLYNLYPRNSWKQITKSLFQKTTHDEIIVHISLPWYKIFNLFFIKQFLKKNFNITEFFWSFNNRKLGETVGFNKVRNSYDFSNVSIFTYVHSKGSSRKRKYTQAVRDWTDMMRYFVIERNDLCIKAFDQGFHTYGVNKKTDKLLHLNGKYGDITFHYSGNFVSVNLDKLRDTFLHTPTVDSYYGIELFWHNLTDEQHAYSQHESGVKDHYYQCYPANLYR